MNVMEINYEIKSCMYIYIKYIIINIIRNNNNNKINH